MRGLGHIPDAPDARDRLFSARLPVHPVRANEERFDDLVKRVRDQQNTSSCVGNSGGSAIELRRALDGLPYTPISALDLYWNSRAVDGYQNEDAGAQIRSAARIAHSVGVASEAAWPFFESRVNLRPSMAADTDGVTRADGTYERIDGEGDERVEMVLDALQARAPVWFGTLVDERLMNALGPDTIPAPGMNDAILGGHAMVACGFSNHGERIRVLSSWSTSFGDGGFVWMAAEWFAYPGTSDIWVLRPRAVEVKHV